ncbi:hypothetical protein KCP77_02695 [Salmonella enterica subsp. enterica]|nr:hypothetical protein KCP77_02695 [Salmonella enterica subsp. enterica]
MNTRGLASDEFAPGGRIMRVKPLALRCEQTFALKKRFDQFAAGGAAKHTSRATGGS